MPLLQSALSLVVPTIVIVGLVVLIALGKVDQTAGLALIGTLAGVHGGAAVASGARRDAASPTPHS